MHDVVVHPAPHLLERRPWYKALPYIVRGDLDAFIAVFSNNLATMLVGVGIIGNKIGEERTFDYVVPGVAVSMVFGCVWYAVQAQIKAAATGRTDLCAQPFGINTPGVFAFAYSVIFPVYFGAEPSMGHAKAAELAWQVGVLGNFVQGVVEVALSLIGPSIARAVPMVALLGSLASIGLTFLFTNSFQDESYAPLVGMIPFYMILMALYANVKLPYIPPMFPPVAVGTAMAWLTRQVGVTSADEVSDNIRLLGWHPCRTTLDPFHSFSRVAPYIPVILPVALTVSVGTIQCREVAAKVGDDYNLRWSMLGDGLASIIASLFGSPFGMTVFIGHPGFKTMGAKVGYNFLCGGAFVLVCFSGMAGLFKAIFPPQALNPILLFVGLAICCDALEITPSRHWPALMLSLVPCFCNWAVTQASNFASMVCSPALGSNCKVNPTGPGAWTLDPTGSLRGLFALGQGYLLTSIYLTSMLIFVIDRNFMMAAIWALVAAASASIGLIHSETLFLPWVGPAAPPAADGHFDARQFDLHWHFVGAYLGLAVLFGGCAKLQADGHVPKGPISGDESHHQSFILGNGETFPPNANLHTPGDRDTISENQVELSDHGDSSPNMSRARRGEA